MTRSQLKRAIAPAAKTERRDAILRGAETLLRRRPAGTFSVDELARRAGLAKGTVYLYFRTREEVLLAVHLSRLNRLFDALEQEPDVGASTAARATLQFLRANPEFLPLAVNCRGMLEAKVSTDAALAFKVEIGRRLARLGARVDARYPDALAPGDGFKLLIDSFALILGLWQLIDPPASLKEAMKRPEMQMFRLDYEAQLESALLALWGGATRQPGRKGSP